MARRIAFTACIALFVGCRGATSVQSLTVSTVAGNGTHGFIDGPGAAAELASPTGVAVDSAGNAYIADSQNLRIRKIDSSGNVTTLAGNGDAGNADGSGGPNGAASFQLPVGVAVDTAGNVLVADANQIRTIAPNGTVSTLAGTVVQGTANGQFASPGSVSVDGAGNVYVADTFNNRIQKIDASGNTTTLAGNELPGYVDSPSGDAGVVTDGGGVEFNAPGAVAVDPVGNVYVADTGNNAIRKIDTQGNVTTVAGNGSLGYADGPGGVAGVARFNAPSGLAVDLLSNVYVVDQGNNRLRQIDLNGNVTTLAGNGVSGFADGTGGPAGVAEFNKPVGLALSPAGTLFVADQNNNRIRLVQ